MAIDTPLTYRNLVIYEIYFATTDQTAASLM
jgi:hypothetical protein